METTGLADPAPVAQTFFMDEDVRAKAQLDTVVALVDCQPLSADVEDAPEAEDQVAFADVVILNKTDLVDGDELAKVRATVRKINPHAVIHAAERSGSRSIRCWIVVRSISTVFWKTIRISCKHMTTTMMNMNAARIAISHDHDHGITVMIMASLMRRRMIRRSRASRCAPATWIQKDFSLDQQADPDRRARHIAAERHRCVQRR